MVISKPRRALSGGSRRVGMGWCGEELTKTNMATEVQELCGVAGLMCEDACVSTIYYAYDMWCLRDGIKK